LPLRRRLWGYSKAPAQPLESARSIPSSYFPNTSLPLKTERSEPAKDTPELNLTLNTHNKVGVSASAGDKNKVLWSKGLLLLGCGVKLVDCSFQGLSGLRNFDY
jgi:hypothetical protein